MKLISQICRDLRIAPFGAAFAVKQPWWENVRVHAVMGEEGCCTFLRTEDGTVISSSTASPLSDLRAECKLKVISHSYLSASWSTYILCLKTQTPMLQRSLKPEQDAPSTLVAHDSHGKTKIFGYHSCKRDLFLIIDYIFILFLSAMKTMLLSQEQGTESALCACS